MPGQNFKDRDAIIAFAVEREEEAARAYGDMIPRAQSESLRLLLADLKSEEEHHKRLLLSLSSSRVASPRAAAVTDLRISDFLVEAPLDGEMSLQDLIIFAAKKEQKAVELYSRLLALASAADEKKLFEFLVSQEKQHKLRLESEYEKHVLGEN
ncbi:MAG: hypothetical protein A2Y56_02675 [Candidatus Aminicenantes bacterium RBG_13_63_10]|nr:MAG: hypothetical protein A2Y56_02675 [Candidatus Aminicenantes bacterium RBG_13_63_10]